MIVEDKQRFWGKSLLRDEVLGKGQALSSRSVNKRENADKGKDRDFTINQLCKQVSLQPCCCGSSPR